MLKLYNSYTKKKQVFKPYKGKIVTMYNCGPTVYDYAHIGNLRSFLFADVLRRYFEYRNYKVKQVMNITDVGHMTTDAEAGEDKMSLAMKRDNKGHKEVARFFEEKFFEDLNSLGIEPAFKYPRATEHIQEMIGIITKLIKNKKAYFVPNSGVYYDLSQFENYGKLSGNKLEDLLAGARVDVIQEKKNPYDFALWICNPKHILKWPSPWGVGYPGWHIECSAMAMKYLGPTIDIHTGGEDNKFPHHECEIAQSEGATKKQFARFWLHAKHLFVDGKKMSKSLGNFYTLRDLMSKSRALSVKKLGFEQPISPRAIRYLLISSHYRESLNFTFKGLDAAQKALDRIDGACATLRGCRSTLSVPRDTQCRTGTGHSVLSTDKARQAFIAAMDDDLNVSKALAAVFEFIRAVNKKGALDKEAIKFLREVDAVLGLGIDFDKQKSAIPAEVLKLAEQREQARKNKDWAQADNLRAQLKEMGYVLEDSADGPKVKCAI